MRRATIWVATVLLFASSWAPATFYRIADTSTAVPDGTGTFASFDPPSSNREALPYDPIETSFRAVSSTGVKGIYDGYKDYVLPKPNSDTLVRRIADTTMTMPGFTENYGDFISISGYSWSAVGSGGTNVAAYNNLGVPIAKTGDTVAGVMLNTFGQVSWGNYDSPFNIVYQANNRIFNTGGALIASNAIAPSIARFGGSGASSVVVGYRNPASTTISEYILPQSGPSSTRAVANLSTAIPNGTGNFTGFGDATATLSYVLFRGMGTDQQGIYRSTTSGALSRVADLTTIAPDGSGAHFTAFQDPSPGDEFSEYDAFVASLSDGREGIYLAKGSTLAKLIDTGDPLDGRTINHLFLSRDAIEDHNVGFKATFTDGSQGVYAVVAPFNVPEPASAVVLLTFPLLRARKRDKIARDRSASRQNVSGLKG